MKKENLYLLLFVIWVYVLGCNQLAEESVSKESKVSMLLKSKKYNNVNNKLIDFGKKIKKSYSVISNEDRHKVMLLVDSINNSSLHNKEALAKELFLFLDIDVNAFVKIIEEDVFFIRKYISSNEINVGKLKIESVKNAKIPAVKSSTEQSIDGCMAACAAIGAMCVASCTPVAFTGCYALCLAAYAGCCLAC